MTSMFKSRTGAVVAGAAVLAALGGVGTAAAAGTIGSSQIRDHSIRSVDFRKGAVGSSAILNGSVNKYDLSKSVQALLDLPGPAGAKGDTGAAGTDGSNGAAGSNGSNGAAGTNGAAGSNGTDGTDGKSAYELYAASTSDDPVLSESDWLASLKGAQGDKGEPGTNGTNGDPGTNGTDGTDGKSAYELYAASTSDDPVLSESDWLASLKGAQGDKGEPGTNGTNGDPGTNGTDGTDGTDGVSGWERVSVTSNFGNNTSASVSCPTGKSVLGGGLGGPTNITLQNSYPSADGTWTVVASKAQGNGTISGTVWAVCATVS